MATRLPRFLMGLKAPLGLKPAGGAPNSPQALHRALRFCLGLCPGLGGGGPPLPLAPGLLLDLHHYTAPLRNSPMENGL